MLFFAALLAAPAGCERKAPPPPAAPKTERFAPQAASIRNALATWYEVPENSLAAKRAPGEWTAAHDELPLGAYVRVTHLANKKAVVVRITDRGVGGDRIDLCKEAAHELGMIEKGQVKARLEELTLLQPVAGSPTP